MQPFGTAYQAHVEDIYRYVYYRLRDKEQSEDLTSQIFLRALEKYDQFSPEKGTFKAWLYGIAKHALTDHYRSQRLTAPLEMAEDHASDASIMDEVHASFQRQEVRDALQKLEPEQREILLLRVWDDLSFQEIAAMLDQKEGACKMRYKRALLALEKHLTLSTLLMLSTLSLLTTVASLAFIL